jgi:hypothetical protein
VETNPKSEAPTFLPHYSITPHTEILFYLPQIDLSESQSSLEATKLDDLKFVTGNPSIERDKRHTHMLTNVSNDQCSRKRMMPGTTESRPGLSELSSVEKTLEVLKL